MDLEPLTLEQATERITALEQQVTTLEADLAYLAARHLPSGQPRPPAHVASDPRMLEIAGEGEGA